MERRVWPVELPTNNIFTQLEKDLYTKVKRTKLNAWFLFDIDPVGLSNEKVRMAVIVHPNKGIITLSMHSEISSEVFKIAVDTYTDMI